MSEIKNKKSLDISYILQSFDLFSKVDDDFRVKTSSGALCIKYIKYIKIGSIATFTIMFLLMFAQVYTYFSPQRIETISVDREIDQKLRINFNFTFFALHCGRIF